MSDFQIYIADYQELLECPDPLTLLEFKDQVLDPFNSRKIQNHLSECSTCQATLSSLDSFSEQELDLDIPDNLLNVDFKALPEHNEIEPAPGQVWLLKSELNLEQEGLSVSQENTHFKSGQISLVVITKTGKYHLGKDNFLELSVCPISEEILMATSEDLLLDQPSLTNIGSIMVQAWNQRQVLSMQLDTCLGILNEQEMTYLNAMLTHQQDIIVPCGGTVVSKDGAHQRFRQIQQEQAELLELPLQSLKDNIRSFRPVVAEITHNGLKSLGENKAMPKWLNLPKIHLSNQSLAPVLAASALQEVEVQDMQTNSKQTLYLDNVALDVWIEGANLEFHCYQEGAADIQGLSIDFIDIKNQRQTIHTDMLGTVFIPLNELPSNEIIVFKIIWQGTTWHYPLSYQAD